MRFVLVALLLVTACKGEANTAPLTPPDNVPVTKSAITSAKAADASVGTTQPPPLQDAGEAPSWDDLIAAAKELKATWPTLAKNMRMARYREWSARTHRLSETLKEEGDGEKLTQWVREGTLPASVRAVGDEGYFYALYASEAWILKTFPNLDADERAFLRWKVSMAQDEWFAEGDLQVSVNDITKGYKGGLRLLEDHPGTAREADIKNELEGIVLSLAGLVWQSPAPYQASRYQRDVKKAFDTLASSKLHRKIGEAFLRNFPVKGMPYDAAEAEALLSTLGVGE